MICGTLAEGFGTSQGSYIHRITEQSKTLS